MKIEDFALEYEWLNKSFREKLVFNVGIDAGFFSEINNMIFAMLYCLDNRIQFTLFSDNSNFTNGRGWKEFFEPFCCENHLKGNIKFNKKMIDPSLQRKGMKSWRRQLYLQLWKKIYGINYLTFEIWDKFYLNPKFIRKIFEIEKLGLSGNSFQASRNLAEMVWRFNLKTKREIEQIIKKVELPASYVSVHIRGGDKILEKIIHGGLLEAEDYVEKLERCVQGIKNVFVFTDDYHHIERLRMLRPQWNIYTLCGEEENGYVNSDFQQQRWDIKKAGMLKLFANIEIIRGSEYFLGTNTANPDWFLSMMMLKEKFCCIQCDVIDWS